MKRLFGADIDAIEVPGMEIGTISKYGINILQDFKQDEAPIRPAAADILQRRLAGKEVLPSTHCLPLGFPLVTLLSEFTKVVQTPDLIIIMLELDNTYRQIYTDGRKLPTDP